jgi:type IV pilus assembly protein PilC
MKQYTITYLDAENRKQNITLSAPSKEAAAGQVFRDNLIPLQIRESSPSLLTTEKRIPESTLLEVCNTLAVLTKSGLEAGQALAIAGNIFTKKNEQSFVGFLSEQVKKGEKISDALSNRLSSKTGIIQAMIQMGEETGDLSSAFTTSASYLHERKSIRDKILSASLYPAIIFTITILGLFVLVVFGIPALKESLADFSSLGDANILGIANRFQWIMGIVAFLLFIPLAFIPTLNLLKRKYKQAGLILGRLELSIPVLKQVAEAREMFNFFYSLDVLNKSGVPLQRALHQSKDIVQNYVFKEEVERIERELSSGENFSQLLGSQFPQRVISWVKVGEESGSMEEVFSQITDYYRDEMEQTMSRLAALAEPVLILLLGGFMILAVILFVAPLLTMFDQIG